MVIDLTMEIHLTKNQVTIVDDEDYDELSHYKWYAIEHKLKSKTVYYAKRYERYKPLNKRTTR